jgi:hypothetical protein
VGDAEHSLNERVSKPCFDEGGDSNDFTVLAEDLVAARRGVLARTMRTRRFPEMATDKKKTQENLQNSAIATRALRQEKETFSDRIQTQRTTRIWRRV